MSNGKGDSPRNCFSERFRKNYDGINWSKKPGQEKPKRKAKK